MARKNRYEEPAWPASSPTRSRASERAAAAALASARATSSRDSARSCSGCAPEQLAALALPERLEEAIAEARRLTSFGAKRRQVLFIGKLMRQLDEEMLPPFASAVRAQVT